MDYLLHYQRLINRAPKLDWEGEKRKAPTWLCRDGVHREGHRIVPGCSGGRYVSHNVVYLTPREHFFAHQLLVRINPKNKKLIYAAHNMGVLRSRDYEWLRLKFIETLKTDDIRKEKIRKTLTGRKRGPFSEETRRKMSLAHIGQRKDQKIGAPSVESRHKMSIARMGKIPWNKGKKGYNGNKPGRKPNTFPIVS